MEELLKQYIFKYYGISAIHITPYGHLWKLSTESNEYMIKSYRKPYIVHWLSYLSDELKRKGFKNFPTILKNKKGNPYIRIENNYYIVMPYLKGASAKYNNINDTEKVVKELATFHHYGCFLGDEFFPPNYDSINKKMEERLQRFKDLFSAISLKKEKVEMERKIFELGKDLILFAEKSIENLNNSELNRYRTEANENRMVSHRDVASHNFLIGEHVWIIDFDLSSYDPQFIDLAQLLNRAMLEWKWNLEVFQKIETIYQENKKLRSGEIRLIHQLSQFPNEFFREVIGYYYHPLKYKQKTVLKTLNKFYQDFEKYTYFQKHINN